MSKNITMAHGQLLGCRCWRDWEENDPAVNRNLPCDFDFLCVEQKHDDPEDDNSSTDSAEYHSNEDYSPPDTAEADHLAT